MILLMSASLIFAFSFSDLFTGKTVQNIRTMSGGQALNPSEWEESDNGNNPAVAGAVYIGDRIYFDVCNNQKSIKEYFIKDDKVRSKNIKCDFGCESVDFTFKEQSSSTGQCKAAPEEGRCREVGDVVNDPFTPGVVLIRGFNNVLTYKVDSVIDEGNGKVLIEYYCDGNKRLAKDTYRCNGVIRSQNVDVGGGITKSANYCEIRPVTCIKNGKDLRYTKPNGEDEVKRDRCLGLSQSEDSQDNEDTRRNVSGANTVQFFCRTDEFDIDGDNDVDINDLRNETNDPQIRAAILGFLRDGQPFERVVSNCGLPGCSSNITAVWCNQPTCVETDSRIAKRRASEVKIVNVSDNSILYSANDTCVGDNRVLEFWCPTQVSKFISAKDLPCGSGRVCVNGACVTR
ncbi:MAG: hypothetical protein QXI33_00720 [Candidatus Pacearchaeota archaeon]